jgi:chromosomal replication initiation ATPase DnaA
MPMSPFVALQCRCYSQRESADTAIMCGLLQAATAAAFGVPVAALRARSRRSAEVAFARQSAMYVAHVMLGLSYSAIGALFRRDRTTAAHACQTVEDRRDDPAIDALLQRLERTCFDLATSLLADVQVRP